MDELEYYKTLFFSGYVIEKRDLTHGGGWVPAVSYVNPKYNHAVVPRLLEGTKYEFRVFAENLQGRSDPLDTEKPVVAKNQYGGQTGKTSFCTKSNYCFSVFRCSWKTWKTRTCG